MIGGFKITLLSLWHFETPDKFCTCTPCQVFTRGNTKNKRVYNRDNIKTRNCNTIQFLGLQQNQIVGTNVAYAH